MKKEELDISRNDCHIEHIQTKIHTTGQKSKINAILDALISNKKTKRKWKNKKFQKNLRLIEKTHRKKKEIMWYAKMEPPKQVLIKRTS